MTLLSGESNRVHDPHPITAFFFFLVNYIDFANMHTISTVYYIKKNVYLAVCVLVANAYSTTLC